MLQRHDALPALDQALTTTDKKQIKLNMPFVHEQYVLCCAFIARNFCVGHNVTAKQCLAAACCCTISSAPSAVHVPGGTVL